MNIHVQDWENVEHSEYGMIFMMSKVRSWVLNLLNIAMITALANKAAQEFSRRAGGPASLSLPSNPVPESPYFWQQLN